MFSVIDALLSVLQPLQLGVGVRDGVRGKTKEVRKGLERIGNRLHAVYRRWNGRGLIDAPRFH
jgi:hypothetical protein